MTTVTWPEPAMFRAVMRRPDQVLRDPELCDATIAWDVRSDQALAWSGSQATVVRATCRDGASYAVRFLARKNADAQDRYESLGRHLSSNPAPALARSWWLPEGLALGESRFPVLKMDWIDGTPLEEWVTGRLAAPSGPAEIAALARQWRQICAHLIDSGVSHGDIHAGNTLIQRGAAGTAIRLVDYDNIWVPGMRALRGERGHPAYQHPSCDTDAGLHRDAFPNTLMYLNLMAVAAQPSLWAARTEGDDILLLQRADLLELDRPIWHTLARSPDPAVVRLSAMVIGWLAARPDAFTTLDEAATEAQPRTATPHPSPNVWAPARVPTPTGPPAHVGSQRWAKSTESPGSSPPAGWTGPRGTPPTSPRPTGSRPTPATSLPKVTGLGHGRHPGGWTVLVIALILVVLWYIGHR